MKQLLWNRSLQIRLCAVWAALLLVAAARAESPGRSLVDSGRYSIFMLGNRIGAMTTRTYSLSAAGRARWEIEADSSIKIEVLGQPVEQTSWMAHTTGDKGDPLKSRYRISSLGRTTEVEADYEPGRILCTLRAEGVETKKTLTVPAGADLTIDPSLAPEKAKPRQGEKQTLTYLEPATLSLQQVRLTVEKREKRKVAGREVEAWLVRSQDSLTGAGHSWIDDEGRLIEEVSAAGIRIAREDLPQDAAPEKRLDVAAATAVETNVRIPDPRKLKFLKVRFSGIPRRELILSNPGQRVTSIREDESGSFSGLYALEVLDRPSPGAPLLRRSDPYTAMAQYLDLEDPAIIRESKAAVGDATDRTTAAVRIDRWVHARMKEGVNVALPRGAAEIMSSRQGVCRDYATLFAALARSAGVPARVCSGVIYHDGRFYYHAWVECRLTDGADGWHPFDPTLPDGFVDATHVKFTEGDPLSMYGSISLIGQLKAEITAHGETARP